MEHMLNQKIAPKTFSLTKATLEIIQNSLASRLLCKLVPLGLCLCRDSYTVVSLTAYF